MLTQLAAGRVFDFSHAVGRGAASGMGFRTPVALAAGEGDTIYVVNRGWEQITNVPWNRTQLGTRVSKLTIGPMPGDEEFVADISGPGDGPGELIWPAGIALDRQENLYVTDEWLNRVPIFDKDGKFLGDWGTSGSDDGELNGPSGIAIDRQDTLYIEDSRNHRVQKITKDGKFRGKWGSFGSGDAESNCPWGMTIDQQGCVYVADHHNHRVQKFTPTGELVATFGAYGIGRAQLNRPSDVAVDPDGDVYVCDWANNRVQVFAPDGRFLISLLGDAQELSKWAKPGVEASPDAVKRRREMLRPEREWRFSLPTGVTFDANKGRVIVADTQRSRLQIYNKLKDYAQPSRTI
jgi:DNA-binding beta-propeller fold protein YncE